MSAVSRRTVRLAIFGLAMVPIALAAVFIRSLLAPIDLSARLEAVKRASVILDRQGREVTTLYAAGRVWVPLSKIPPFLRRAVVASEDIRFYRHRGIDPRGVARALYQDLRAGRFYQGGSTITQQLAKIVLLTSQRTFWRKASDIAYALRIERQYSKDEILQFYLNEVYLGHGAVGVEGAAQTYFGRHVWELNRREAAMIVGLIRGPEYYSPFRRPKVATDRVKTVLEAMVRARYLKPADIRKITGEPLHLLASPGRASPGGYFISQVIAEIRQRFGWSEEYIRRAGLEIRTTMDAGLQRAAEDTIRLLPVGYKEQGVAQPQGAIVALDPANGAVRALVGGRDYLTSPLNRATRSPRQPGSAIKPFAFAAAMEKGYSPASILVDEPSTYWVDGRSWQPRNYDDEYRGPITLREAMEESVNTIAVKLVQDLGPRLVFDLARRMGLSSLVAGGTRNDVGLAPLALGGLTKGVTPLELTAAYAAFSNGGFRVEPYFYTTITDRSGNVITVDEPRRQRVISARTAYLVTDMMRGVITRGTGARASIGRPAAGKTGTTTDYTNGWFVGYTPELVTGVWIGNDRGDRPMRTSQGNLGSGMASALWGVFMERALAERPWQDFLPPWATVPTLAGRSDPSAAEVSASPPPFTSAWWDLVRRRLGRLLGGSR